MSDDPINSHHHPPVLSPAALRAKAIEALLLEKGLLASDAIDRIVEIYEKDVGPLNGAKVVARAWCDPTYKRRLLKDATAAIAELGFGGIQGEHMTVVENTPKVHNVVCCTLCSCYPWPVLGLPPVWYKVDRLSGPDRSRTACCASRIRSRSSEVCRSPGVGQQRGDALSSFAGASARYRRDERDGARVARHARFHDRRRQDRGAQSIAVFLHEPDRQSHRR